MALTISHRGQLQHGVQRALKIRQLICGGQRQEVRKQLVIKI